MINLPVSETNLPQEAFNSDPYSTERKYEEVKDICLNNLDKLIDLRPYLIAEPYVI